MVQRNYFYIGILAVDLFFFCLRFFNEDWLAIFMKVFKVNFFSSWFELIRNRMILLAQLQLLLLLLFLLPVVICRF